MVGVGGLISNFQFKPNQFHTNTAPPIEHGPAALNCLTSPHHVFLTYLKEIPEGMPGGGSHILTKSNKSNNTAHNT